MINYKIIACKCFKLLIRTARQHIWRLERERERERESEREREGQFNTLTESVGN